MTRVKKLARRYWSREELGDLKRLYAESTAAELGRRFGRTASAVMHAVRDYGLTKQRHHQMTPATLERVRSLHAAGLSDEQVAAEIGCSRPTVRVARRKLGLAPNGHAHPAQRERTRAATRRQCEAAGAASLIELRWRAHEALAAGYGWPGLPLRCVQILTLLATRGPMSPAEIAATLGLRAFDGRTRRERDRPGQLVLLEREGLVYRLRRHDGTRRISDLFVLTPAAVARLEAAASAGGGE